MATLKEVEGLTKDYADAGDNLAATLTKLERTIERLRRMYMPGIKKQVAIAKQRKAALETAINDSKDLFRKPKTQIMHGVKVGYKKGGGKLIIDDNEYTVRLIKKHFPDKTEEYIKTKETPRKEALEALTAAELKTIAVQVEGTGDVIVIARVDSDVEKMVNKLLKEKTEETDSEEDAA